MDIDIDFRDRNVVFIDQCDLNETDSRREEKTY